MKKLLPPKYIERATLLSALAALIGQVAAAQTTPGVQPVRRLPAGAQSNQGRLTADAQGNLYGTTLDGGKFGYGVVFRLSPPSNGSAKWTSTVLHNFTGGVIGALAMDDAGNLFGSEGYGTTLGSNGRVFELIKPQASGSAWTYKILHEFPIVNQSSSQNDGWVLAAGVTIGPDHVLYGTTIYGGYVDPSTGFNYGLGTVFSLSPPSNGSGTWDENVLYRFQGTGDSVSPNGGVILDAAGNLYGTAYGLETQPSDQAYDYGAVFMLSPPALGGTSWTYHRLHRFTGGEDGIYPSGTLTWSNTYGLLGTTQYGGSGSGGVVYSVQVNTKDPEHSREQVIASFGGSENTPYDGVTIDPMGRLLGTTVGANVNFCGGSVFLLTPPQSASGAWAQSTLALLGEERGAAKVGCFPESGLTVAPSGAIFGVGQSSTVGFLPKVFTVAP